MKIIGKNSLSQYIAYLMYIMFVIILLHLIYESIGHLILSYKYQTGSKIFPNTFILGNDVGWVKNKWTLPMENDLKYKINYPFTDINFVTGLYKLSNIIKNILVLGYFSFFFYTAFKCFNEMSNENLFNLQSLKWLKRFNYIVLIYGIYNLGSFFYFDRIYFSSLFSFIAFSLLGIIVLFIIEFFKKGLELQTENDLTI